MKWQTLFPVALIAALSGWALLLFLREDSVATVDPNAALVTAVIVAPVAVEEFPYEIEAVGTALADESVEVTATVTNLINAVRFQEGQHVERGSVLVELEDDEARAELAVAEATLAESRSQLRRAEELYSTQAVSAAEFEQLEARVQVDVARVASARARLEDTVIRAPFAGRTGLRRVSVGSLITPGTLITTLDDTDPIKLEFSVPEAFLSALKPGLEVTARSVAYRDSEFRGEVASIDSRVDPVSRSVTVRALIDNDEQLLKPGMFLTVRLVERRSRALLIPEEAVVPIQDRQYVFVVEQGRARRLEITIGRRRAGEVEVAAGLSPGETVVVEGLQRLRDGAEVRVVDRQEATT